MSISEISLAVFPVALFTRAWIEINSIFNIFSTNCVALFTRAWIEIYTLEKKSLKNLVALFTRAWIEIPQADIELYDKTVALFTRAWIEIGMEQDNRTAQSRRPLHEGVDRNIKPVTALIHTLGRPLHEGVD